MDYMWGNWVYRLLHPGKCTVCGRVLPDDADTPTCSEECASAYWW